MSYHYAELFAIERPRALMDAARQLLLIGTESSKKIGDNALRELISIEAKLEEQRSNSDLRYDSHNHIRLLARLIGQARILYKEDNAEN